MKFSLNFLKQTVTIKVLVLGVLFFVISNPMTFDLVDSVITVKNANGPTQMGVGIHAVVFMILTILVSKMKS
tara:strand:- start:10566 stop:10781 length:216 start_codon:yes stop_codon:yes gene_type:complete